MSDIINDYFESFDMDREGFHVYPRLQCVDGFEISVQARAGCYCKPRENNAFPYYAVECGYPSGPVPELAEWKDTPESPDENTVYGYVPTHVVVKLIESHGGLSPPKEAKP